MAKKKTAPAVCCAPGNFPQAAVLLLIVGIVWLLQDLQIIAINIPWLPIVLIILALAKIKYHKK